MAVPPGRFANRWWPPFWSFAPRPKDVRFTAPPGYECALVVLALLYPEGTHYDAGIAEGEASSVRSHVFCSFTRHSAAQRRHPAICLAEDAMKVNLRRYGARHRIRGVCIRCHTTFSALFRSRE